MQVQEMIEQPFVSALGRGMTRNRFLVLAYHGVEDPDRFRAQLLSVLAHRRPIGLDEVEERLGAGRDLPAGRFLVTFDDGRRSVLRSGLPVLQELAVPAALFVVAGLIGTDEPFWWDEVEARSLAGGTTAVASGAGAQLVRAVKGVADSDRRRALDELRAATPDLELGYPHLSADELIELDRSGVSIGSHSLTHPCLDRCADDDLRHELIESREVLQEILGRPVRTLAYPNGNVDRRVVGAAEDAGYRIGFAFDHRLASRHPDPLLVPRVRVDLSNPTRRFESIVSGIHPAIHHLRGRA